MKLTVVTPVLNGALFIEEALRSVATQTHDDVEHIVVDGGSSDGTQDLVRSFQRRYPHVSLEIRPGASQYEAIDDGFSVARGQVLSWLNADDLYVTSALGRVVSAFQSNPKVTWVSGFPACWNAAGELVYVRPQGHWPRWMIRNGWFHGGLLGYLQQETMFFTRDLYSGLTQDERHTFRSANLAGDYLLWRIFARRSDLTCIPTVLGGFRRHGSNRSIASAAAYRDEVLESRPAKFPGWLSPRIRGVFVRWSAWKAHEASVKLDDTLDCASIKSCSLTR